MKKLALLLSVLSFSCAAADNDQNKQYSVGLGMGALYSGIGANVAMVSSTDMKYISAGCVRYSNLSGSTCGFGAGWVTTDLFDFNSNKHGFGVYAGVVDSKGYTNSQWEYDNSAVYGVGIGYNYFLNGINKSGLTVGISIHAANTDDGGPSRGFLQLGYQF